MVAAREGWCPEFTKAYYRAWFMDDRPAGLDDNMPGLLASIGRDPEEVLARANAESLKTELDESANESATDRAVRVATFRRARRGLLGRRSA